MPLSDNNRDAFLTLQSGHISDAMEEMELPRTVLHGYTYLGTPGARMVGIAYTVQQTPKHVTTGRLEALVSHADVSRELASEGEVILIDAGGRTDSGTWGENHCMRARPRGISGAVINGATRDAHEIKSLDFPVFCKGVSPVKSQWDLETISHNQPINLDGVQIRAGDIVFGDETGIIIVPPEMQNQILDAAQRVREKEAEWAKGYEK
tara:strand:- start:267 stop:890 length:624 start_codon:yes stop_codon:yes gene_type:complete